MSLCHSTTPVRSKRKSINISQTSAMAESYGSRIVRKESESMNPSYPMKSGLTLSGIFSIDSI